MSKEEIQGLGVSNMSAQYKELLMYNKFEIIGTSTLNVQS